MRVPCISSRNGPVQLSFFRIHWLLLLLARSPVCGQVSRQGSCFDEDRAALPGRTRSPQACSVPGEQCHAGPLCALASACPGKAFTALLSAASLIPSNP